MKVEEISYQLENLTLVALACGNKAHEPVLFLHGYLDNAASFLPLMQVIMQQARSKITQKDKKTGRKSLIQAEIEQVKGLSNRRIIALEWPGHGHSDHRSNGAHYHFFDYVHDLVSLFNNNDWPAIDIVAHSMGAMVASAFAAAFPEKVKSLTLIDSLGFIYAPAEQATKQLRQGILSRTNSIKPTRHFNEGTAIKARLNVSDLQERYVKLIVQRSLVQIEYAKTTDLPDSVKLFSWRSDSRLRTISPYRLTLSQGQQLLSDIKCPVQLIYGDKGMLEKGLKVFSTYLKNFTEIKVTGGHHVHMEQAEKIYNIINDFFQESKIKTRG